MMHRALITVVMALVLVAPAHGASAATPDTPPTDTAVSGAAVPDSSSTTAPPEPAPSLPASDEVDPPPTDVDDTAVDAPTERVAVPPSVRSSDIPLGSVVIAVLVLGAFGVAALVLVRRQPQGRSRRDVMTGSVAPAMDEPPTPATRAPMGSAAGVDGAGRQRSTHDTATLDFLVGLGQALIDAGDAVSHVESTLRAVARVNGIDGLGVIVLPTALFVSVPGDDDVLTEVSVAGRTPLRLDQVDDVLTLVADSEQGIIDAEAGQRRLQEIRSAPPPYPHRVALLGYMCSTVGLAAILRAPLLELALAAVLGLVVGWFRLATRRLSVSFQPFVPLVAAAAVATLVFGLGRVVDDLQTFPLLVSPLITFLPGALLTIGVLELATGQNVSGASRLASGAMQLVLLSLGLVAGSELVGVPAGDLGSSLGGPVGAFVPWIGVGVFGIGVVWFNGARSSARIWIVLVLYVAYAGQVIGGLFFGSALVVVLRCAGDDTRRAHRRSPAIGTHPAGDVPAGILDPGARRLGARRRDPDPGHRRRGRSTRDDGDLDGRDLTRDPARAPPRRDGSGATLGARAAGSDRRVPARSCWGVCVNAL